MKAMILAAGRGERMRPLTDSLPKPLLAVGGKPLIVHHIDKLKDAGVTDLVINHAWLGHKLVEALGDGRQFGVDIQWSAEESALETAGGIIQALPLLGDEPFLVINGDTWLDLDYRTLVSQPLSTGLAHLWLVPNPPQHPAGDFALQAGKVVDSPALTFSGVGLYDPAAFAGLTPGARKLAPLLREWMAQGRVGGSLLAGEWHDIGTVARLQALDEQLQGRTH
ncbi:TPA: nucleotidyltransferase family protein [Aeromonas hydrophila]|jgi:MurNAc alpha-1-phosphate uridylyltransferase|uniref:N-acetylmuramate alpha-1-phosphate uridylyltransferase MurU n=1 Tax=Aeromonas hydrophila TaxID=644 RepID=UPI000032380A|nr:nucleotidyltransferase family protein [Aeromonas hydrophila]BDC83717.1 mannose-1-phosphate guanylyltransferase [Aeromonas hydrophila]HAT2490118.1 nucleotidyltransferase family protein [Aeromonas hydrophila]HAT2494848.1 nucleotidyltransferase family protein [Aeromonas hydrophila]HAT2510319.1 nucleotidyltransferase family protein [Aeromonas hydrophila]HAT2530768.1 nucleotidyltransferase family protein [Aeromonas hydrophila]